jgi:hypothetical protein
MGMKLSVDVFCVARLCGINAYQLLRRMYRLLWFTLQMVATHISETSVNTYRITLHHSPEDLMA